MNLSKKLTLTILILLVFPFLAAAKTSEQDNSSSFQKRNQLIGYMLAKQLPTIHFSDKKMNDEQARAAFTLYIKQLDFQKRFLLKKDTDELAAFTPYIDDNLEQGTNSLPDAGFDILGERIDQVEKIVGEILGGPFDFNAADSLETDPEKLMFAKDLQELRERWRLILKYEVIARDLELEDEAKKAKENKSSETLFQEAKDKVTKRYKEIFHRLRQETRQDHYDRFFNAVTRAFDPHTNYIPPAGKEQFDISMRGSLEGIGALLREDDGFIKVDRIIPGSASAKQGRLQAKDIILQVAQGKEEPVDITDMRLRDAVRLIRGPKGSEVRLTVKKADGARDIIPIIRDVVQIEETFVKSTVLKNPDGRMIGLINIPGFYRDFEKTNNGEAARNSTDDTRKELLDLKSKGVSGIILDLRNNGGGALVDAVDIAGLFLTSGPVVQVKNSNGTVRVLNDEDPEVVYDGPLVVLVNAFSASASEIVAAALQDYKRAVIVGGPTTHGKGTVQTVINLNDNIPLLHANKYDDLGALKVTIQKFYRITGGSTQYKGIEPDITLPSLLQSLKSGERYLEYSLPWDSIAPVAFTTSSEHPLQLAALRNASATRVKGDPGFVVIEKEITRVEERINNTVVSLKIKDMRTKQEESKIAKETVGKQFRLYQDEAGDEENPDAKDSGQEVGNKAWLEEVHEDPYIREANHIVTDLQGKK
ncbi:MAG: carboxy terminal-processing peptidase [Desulfoprunum sp.]|nr:carboxy terminal-processing peptidase [Desulfoprunum sp.]